MTTRRNTTRKSKAPDFQNLLVQQQGIRHAVELWNIRTTCVLKLLYDQVSEISIEASKPNSPLAFLNREHLANFLNGIDRAEQAIHQLLPPCDYLIPDPVAVMRSYAK